MKQKALALKVGLFVLIVLLLFVIGMVFLGFEKKLFTKMNIYTLSSPSGIGLSVGMPVLFSGFEIGIVKNLQLSDNGRVLITLEIPSQHRKWIRDSSSFTLEKPFIGSPRIIVETANMNSPLLSSNTIVDISIVDDINEVIKKADPVLKKINNIAGNLTEMTATEGDLRKGITDIRAITAKLSKKQSLISMATGSPRAAREFNRTIANLHTISKETKTISQRLNTLSDELVQRVGGDNGALAEVTGILRDVRGKLGRLDTFVTNLNKVSGNVAYTTGDLEALRKKIDIIILDTETLLREIEEIIPSDRKKEFSLP